MLHEQVVLLAIETAEVPHMNPAERATVEALGHGFFRILVRYGFMEEPDVPEALAAVRADGLELAPMRTSFFLGRETLIPSRHPGMALWREHLFAVMSPSPSCTAPAGTLPRWRDSSPTTYRAAQGRVARRH